MGSKEMVPSSFLPQCPDIESPNLDEDGVVSSLDLYLRKAKGYSLLTAPEEIDLAKKAQDGNLQAREKLVSHNLRLVVSVARRFNFPSLSLEDLIQDGNIGLIKAIEAFDWTRGTRFSTIATNNIGWEIKDSIAKRYQNISLPGSVFWSMIDEERIRHQFEQDYRRKPTEEELTNLLGNKAEFVKRVGKLPRNFVSLDTTPFDPSDTEASDYHDLIKDDSLLGENPEAITVDKLSAEDILVIINNAGQQREVDIFIHRRGINGKMMKSLAQLASAYDICTSRVGQIEDKFQKKLEPLLQAAGF